MSLNPGPPRTGPTPKPSTSRLGRLGAQGITRPTETLREAGDDSAQPSGSNLSDGTTRTAEGSVPSLRKLGDNGQLPMRKSGLPQRSPSRKVPATRGRDGGQTSITSRANAQVASEGKGSGMQQRQLERPKSSGGIAQHDGTSSANRGPQLRKDTKVSGDSARDPKLSSVGKLPTTSRTSLSGLGRSMSLRKPTLSTTTTDMGVESSLTELRGHRRNQSVKEGSSTTMPRQLTQGFGLGRPPDQRPSSSHSANSGTTKGLSGAQSGAVRQGPPSTGLRRSATTTRTHTRSISEFNASDRPSALQPPSTSRTRQSRPVFSTLQQHYSPKKLPPPSTPASIKLAPETNPEVARLQTELLQLHLMHAASDPVQEQWERSAEEHFRQCFATISAKHAQLRDAERLSQADLNIRAVQTWGGDGRRFAGGLDEKARILSDVLDGMDGEWAEGGRYKRIVEEFERWVAKVQRVWEERENCKDYDAEMDFLEGIGQSWSNDVQTLVRKGEGWLRDMEAIDADSVNDGDQYVDSSLQAVVCGSMPFLRGMLEEARNMTQVERLVASVEQEWVESMVSDILTERSTSKDPEASVHQNIWSQVLQW